MDGVSRAKSALAVEAKKHKRSGGREAELAEARRVLAEEKIRAFVAKAVAGAPPLTDEQLSRLALLFAAGDQR